METCVEKKSARKLLPVLFAFFVMGFVDVVGISTSYVKKDFGLNDTWANLLPMMVFVWFAVASLPTGVLMGRIGRKKTVMLSALITGVAMLLPFLYYSVGSVWMSFALLGIGNTILQVSLNPLLLDIVLKEKVASMLTLGQFIKAISSMLGPVLVGIAAGIWGNWRLIFFVYAVTTCISWGWLAGTPIEEEIENKDVRNGRSIRSLFKSRKLMLAFSMILLIVGFEIGLMTAVPKYLLERCHLPIEQGGLGCSLYFSARTIGTFAGSFVLARYAAQRFLIGNMIAAVGAFVVFMVASDVTSILISLFLIGLFCANVFPIVFSMAMQSNPSKANEISAFMIMGVAGGAVLPLFMGIIADAGNQWLSLWIPLFALVYILGVSLKMK